MHPFALGKIGQSHNNKWEYNCYGIELYIRQKSLELPGITVNQQIFKISPW